MESHKKPKRVRRNISVMPLAEAKTFFMDDELFKDSRRRHIPPRGTSRRFEIREGYLCVLKESIDHYCQQFEIPEGKPHVNPKAYYPDGLDMPLRNKRYR